MKKKQKKFNFKSKVVSASRRIWLYSPVRREVVNRCKVEGGFYRCEFCRKLTEKVQVDHIAPSVPENGWDSWDKYFERLFVSADGMQGLCQPCHTKKTLEEQAKRKEHRAKINAPKPKKKKEEEPQ